MDAARWYLAARGPDQTMTIDVDLAREKSEKNPVYYVQYAHARIAGHPPERRRGRRRPCSAGEFLPPRSETSSNGSPSFPGSSRKRPSDASPQALPTYAIRLADDFHRFYHHHRVLDSEEQSFRLALVTATKAVIARSLDLDRGRGARADVADNPSSRHLSPRASGGCSPRGSSALPSLQGSGTPSRTPQEART